MKKLYPILAAIVVTLAFQNCSPHSMDSGLITRDSSSLTFGDTSLPRLTPLDSILDEVKILEIPRVSFSSDDDPEKTGLNDAYALRVDLMTGMIDLVDRNDASVLASRCLSLTSRDEVVTILQSSQLCEQGRPDKLCAQRYTPEYASLIANAKVIPLGEELDSCGSGKKDLCGESAVMLKGFIKFVKSNWQDMSCE